MALPTVQATSLSATNTDQTSHTVTMPTGILDNQLLLMFCHADETPGITPQNVLGTWTQIVGRNAANSAAKIEIYAKNGAASDSGQNETVNTGTAQKFRARVFVIANWSGTIGDIEQRSRNGSLGNANPYDVTPTWGPDETMWIASMVLAGTEGVDGYPSNMPDNRYISNNTSADAPSEGIATFAANQATFDPERFDNDPEDWACVTMVVRGGTTGAPPPPTKTLTLDQTNYDLGDTVTATVSPALSGTIASLTLKNGDTIAAEAGATGASATFVLPAVTALAPGGALATTPLAEAMDVTVTDGSETSDTDSLTIDTPGTATDFWQTLADDYANLPAGNVIPIAGLTNDPFLCQVSDGTLNSVNPLGITSWATPSGRLTTRLWSESLQAWAFDEELNTYTFTDTPIAVTAVTDSSSGTSTLVSNSGAGATIDGSGFYFVTVVLITDGSTIIPVTPDSVTPTQITFTVPDLSSLTYGIDNGSVFARDEETGDQDSMMVSLIDVAATQPVPIPDQAYNNGDTIVALDLADYFDDAVGYTVDQLPGGLSLFGSIISGTIANGQEVITTTVTALNPLGNLQDPFDWTISTMIDIDVSDLVITDDDPPLGIYRNDPRILAWLDAVTWTDDDGSPGAVPVPNDYDSTGFFEPGDSQLVTFTVTGSITGTYQETATVSLRSQAIPTIVMPMPDRTDIIGTPIEPKNLDQYFDDAAEYMGVVPPGIYIGLKNRFVQYEETNKDYSTMDGLVAGDFVGSSGTLSMDASEFIVGDQSVTLVPVGGSNSSINIGGGAGDFNYTIPPFRRWMVTAWLRHDTIDGAGVRVVAAFEGGGVYTDFFREPDNADVWQRIGWVIDSVDEPATNLRFYFNRAVTADQWWVDGIELFDVTDFPSYDETNLPPTTLLPDPPNILPGIEENGRNYSTFDGIPLGGVPMGQLGGGSAEVVDTQTPVVGTQCARHFGGTLGDDNQTICSDEWNIYNLTIPTGRRYILSYYQLCAVAANTDTLMRSASGNHVGNNGQTNVPNQWTRMWGEIPADANPVLDGTVNVGVYRRSEEDAEIFYDAFELFDVTDYPQYTASNPPPSQVVAQLENELVTRTGKDYTTMAGLTAADFTALKGDMDNLIAAWDPQSLRCEPTTGDNNLARFTDNASNYNLGDLSGKRIIVTFWVREDIGNTPQTYRFDIVDGTSTSLNTPSAAPPSTGEWYRLACEADCTNQLPSGSRMSLIRPNSQTGETIWVDGVELFDVTSNPEFTVSNPPPSTAQPLLDGRHMFGTPTQLSTLENRILRELDGKDYTSMVGLVDGDFSGYNGTRTLTTSEFVVGGQALEITGTDANNGHRFTSSSTNYNIPVRAGRQYMVTAFVKTSGALESLVEALLYTDTEFLAVPTEERTDFSASGEWERHGWKMSVPFVNGGNAYLWFKRGVNFTDTWWMDSVEIFDVTDYPQYDGNTLPPTTLNAPVEVSPISASITALNELGSVTDPFDWTVTTNRNILQSPLFVNLPPPTTSPDPELPNPGYEAPVLPNLIETHTSGKDYATFAGLEASDFANQGGGIRTMETFDVPYGGVGKAVKMSGGSDGTNQTLFLQDNTESYDIPATRATPSTRKLILTFWVKCEANTAMGLLGIIRGQTAGLTTSTGSFTATQAGVWERWATLIDSNDNVDQTEPFRIEIRRQSNQSDAWWIYGCELFDITDNPEYNDSTNYPPSTLPPPSNSPGNYMEDVGGKDYTTLEGLGASDLQGTGLTVGVEASSAYIGAEGGRATGGTLNSDQFRWTANSVLNLTYPPNRRWIATAWVRTDALGGDFRFTIWNGGSSSNSATRAVAAAGTWTRIAGEIDMTGKSETSGYLGMQRRTNMTDPWDVDGVELFDVTFLPQYDIDNPPPGVWVPDGEVPANDPAITDWLAAATAVDDAGVNPLTPVLNNWDTAGPGLTFNGSPYPVQYSAEATNSGWFYRTYNINVLASGAEPGVPGGSGVGGAMKVSISLEIRL